MKLMECGISLQQAAGEEWFNPFRFQAKQGIKNAR